MKKSIKKVLASLGVITLGMGGISAAAYAAPGDDLPADFDFTGFGTGNVYQNVLNPLNFNYFRDNDTGLPTSFDIGYPDGFVPFITISNDEQVLYGGREHFFSNDNLLTSSSIAPGGISYVNTTVPKSDTGYEYLFEGDIAGHFASPGTYPIGRNSVQILPSSTARASLAVENEPGKMILRTYSFVASLIPDNGIRAELVGVSGPATATLVGATGERVNVTQYLTSTSGGQRYELRMTKAQADSIWPASGAYVEISANEVSGTEAIGRLDPLDSSYNHLATNLFQLDENENLIGFDKHVKGENDDTWYAEKILSPSETSAIYRIIVWTGETGWQGPNPADADGYWYDLLPLGVEFEGFTDAYGAVANVDDWLTYGNADESGSVDVRYDTTGGPRIIVGNVDIPEGNPENTAVPFYFKVRVPATTERADNTMGTSTAIIRRGDVEFDFTKVDSETGVAITGPAAVNARFDILDSQGRLVYTGITIGENGHLQTAAGEKITLAPGSYSIVERVAPTGYEIDSVPIDFQATRTGNNSLVIENDPEEVPPPLIEVTPVAPTLVPSNECEVPDKIKIPTTEGVEYSQTRDGNKITVVAKAKDGFTLKEGAKASWTFEIKDPKKCEEPEKPKEELVVTGANGAALIGVSLVLLAAGAGFIFLRRKKA